MKKHRPHGARSPADRPKFAHMRKRASGAAVAAWLFAAHPEPKWPAQSDAWQWHQSPGSKSGPGKRRRGAPPLARDLDELRSRAAALRQVWAQKQRHPDGSRPLAQAVPTTNLSTNIALSLVARARQAPPHWQSLGMAAALLLPVVLTAGVRLAQPHGIAMHSDGFTRVTLELLPHHTSAPRQSPAVWAQSRQSHAASAQLAQSHAGTAVAEMQVALPRAASSDAAVALAPTAVARLRMPALSQSLPGQLRQSRADIAKLHRSQVGAPVPPLDSEPPQLADLPSDRLAELLAGLRSPDLAWAARPHPGSRSVLPAADARTTRYDPSRPPQSRPGTEEAAPAEIMPEIEVAIARPFVRPPEGTILSVPFATHDLAAITTSLQRDASDARPPFRRPPEALAAVPAPPAPGVATAAASMCAAAPGLLAAARGRSVVPVRHDPHLADDPLRFGLALAEAAKAQSKDLVIYNANYMTIAYPRGDVPMQFGVCTDVVIRAYRALDIDLQELVHLSRPGHSDPNIDHRRTELLRQFFASHGEALAVTPYIEDYLPGDIVTYYRPQNRSSTAHIAVVTDITAPTGRPMIAHNRGWGVQLEDALFVDQMTGHYRFRGETTQADAVARAAPVATKVAQRHAAAERLVRRTAAKVGVARPMPVVPEGGRMGLGAAPTARSGPVVGSESIDPARAPASARGTSSTCATMEAGATSCLPGAVY